MDEGSSEITTLTEMFESFLKPCIKAGLSEKEFWNMTYRELINYLDAYQEKALDDIKVNLRTNYELASLISLMVGYTLSGKKIPEYEKLYPNAGETKSAEAEANKIKAQLMNFMSGFNDKRKEINDGH